MSQRTTDPKRLWGIDLPPDQTTVYVAGNNFTTVHFSEDCGYLQKAATVNPRPIPTMNGSRDPCSRCHPERGRFHCDECGGQHPTKSGAHFCCGGGSS